MAFSSVTTMEKPAQRTTFPDWVARVNTLRNVADARSSDAFQIRHSSRLLRNETRIESNWTTYETNEALSDRISELNQWHDSIEVTFKRIIREMKSLEEEKVNTEHELEAMQVPISVISECLTLRDGRIGSDLTYDDADSEIKNELAVVENNQHLLMEQCQKAWEKLNRLEEVKFHIGLELGNKEEASELDTVQLALDKFSSSITCKPDPRRNPKNCCTYEAWKEHTTNMKQMAENELADTYAIREALFVSREKARNLLLAQQDRSDHAIRKRIFETQRARNELDWQRYKLREEMERGICEIRTLEQAWRDKTDSLKLVETRLENRAQRSGMELCLDEAHVQLLLEAEKLTEIRRRLTEKINETKTNNYLLEEHLLRIDNDLENKQMALMTDIRTLDVRQRLKGNEHGNKPKVSSTPQTDRNIVLTKMEQEIPKN